MKKAISLYFVLLTLILTSCPAIAQRKQQALGRGVVAVYGKSNGSAGVEITWRRLAQEPENALYNIYVSKTESGDYTKLNASPLKNTNYATSLTKVPYGSYVAVSIVADGKEGELSKPFRFKDNGLRNMYMEIRYDASPLAKENYTTKFVWPCDLNGDGEYDYVVDRCPVDGSLNYYVEAYLADGTFLWNINLGPNEKPCDGQNDNMCTYDIDCDGYGELIVQTSDGTRFWDKQKGSWGKFLLGKDNGDSDGDGIIDYNNQSTKNPPRYMTVVNGMTGEEKASAEFMYDDAYNRTNKANLMGDEYNKHEAHVGIFYHDGIHPAICGEWTSRDTNKQHHFRNCAFAYDFDAQGKAVNWHQLFMEKTGGEVFHMIRIFDADGDGKDEMSSGAYVMDHDGSTLYNTGISHGDRHRTSDIDPERPGLETFSIQQNAPDMLGMILFDASTGETIKRWYLPEVGDVGRGDCLDLDASHLGWEMFSTMDGYQIYDAKGEKLEGKKGYFPTEGLWWDGALDRENVAAPDGSGYNAMVVDYSNGRLIEMAKESGWTINTSYGARGKYWGDIIGDWREELVLIRIENGVCQGIVGFSTDFNTSVSNIYCLQEDPHYRTDCTTRGYYQSPNPGFYLGYGMPRPQLPPCMVANDESDVFGIAEGNAEITPRSDIKNVYAMPVKGQALTLASPLSAETTLWKSQQGMLVVNGDYTNKTIVSEGTLKINGELKGALDLRARGTIAGNGTINDITLEGALNYEGGRIMPEGTLTFAKGLNVNKVAYVEINRPGTDKVVVNGTLAVTKSLVFSFNGIPDEGEYPLLSFDNFSDTQLKNISVRGLTGASYDLKISDNSLVLSVNKQRQPSTGVVWTGNVNGIWDYQTKNFSLNGAETNFVEGDGVLFNDEAKTTTITLSEMMPVSVAKFAADKKKYTLNGNGGITGRTILNSGKVEVKEMNYNFEIGKATLIVNNSNAVCDNTVLLTDTATISIASGTTSLKNKVSGEGALLKTGNGQLNITFAGSNDWKETILDAGTLAMGAWNTTIGKATSAIHVTGNSVFTVFNNDATSQVPNVQNTFIIDKDKTLTFHAGKRCAIKGALKGSGIFKVDFPYVRGDVYTNTSEFEGTYHVTTTNCRFVQAMNLSKATLKIDKNAAVVSTKAGSGTEQNYNHTIGTLTGGGTLGNGTWTVSRLEYYLAPTIVSGTMKLVSPVIDATPFTRSTITPLPVEGAGEVSFQFLTINGKVTLEGTPVVIPATPKDGYEWDFSTFATDGKLRVKESSSAIETVSINSLKGTAVYDLLGRKVSRPAIGIYIVNGKKVRVTR